MSISSMLSAVSYISRSFLFRFGLFVSLVFSFSFSFLLLLLFSLGLYRSGLCCLSVSSVFSFFLVDLLCPFRPCSFFSLLFLSVGLFCFSFSVSSRSFSFRYLLSLAVSCCLCCLFCLSVSSVLLSFCLSVSRSLDLFCSSIAS